MRRRSLLRSKRVLGIDPGIGHCGWCTGVVSSGAKIFDCGVISTKADKKCDKYKTIDDQRRAVEVLAGLYNIMAAFQPEIISVETPIGGARNAAAVKYIGMSSMLIALLVHQYPERVNRYSPYEMKEHFTGDKTAQKDDMIAEAERRFPGVLAHIKKTYKEHAADAIAALTMEIT